MAATMSVTVGPARKTFPESLAWAKPPKLQLQIWALAWNESADCATVWNQKFFPAFLRRRFAAAADHQQRLLRLYRGRRLRHRHGLERRGMFHRSGVFVGFCRAFARTHGYRPKAGAGAIEHSLQPGPIQHRRGCRLRS